MFIIKPHIFSSFSNLVSGVSTKIGLDRKAPFYFNLSPNVGDDEVIVQENRNAFFNSFGIRNDQIVFQYQIHSDIIKIVDKAGYVGESDALITSKENLAIVLTIADCTPILIYDAKNKVIAAVHSGWRGAENKILIKTLMKMQEVFDSKGENIIAYLGPSIYQVNYEVGKEVAILFNAKYLQQKNGKYFLDVSTVNYDFLKSFGVKSNNIQKSVLCSYQMKELLHSYRRDGANAGRSLAFIMMKGKP